MDCPAILESKGDQMWHAVYGATDGPAIKGSKGGPNVAVYSAMVARGAKSGSIYSTRDCPGITGSKGDQMWQHLMQWMVQIL